MQGVKNVQGISAHRSGWRSRGREGVLIGAAALMGAAATGIATTSAGASASKSPYKVEIVGALTGASDSDGIAGNNGFQAAFDTINAAGGVNGHKISFKSLDDQSSASIETAVGLQAVSANPVAIMDGGTTTEIAAREPTYGQANIPVFSFAGNGGVTFLPYFFSDNATAVQNGRVMVSGMASALETSKQTKGTTLATALKGKKVGLISVSTPGSIGIVASEKTDVAKDGGHVVSNQFSPISAPSFAAGAASFVASGAQVAAIVDTAPDTIVEATALVKAGFTGPIVIFPSASDDTTLASIAYKYAYGVRYDNNAVPGDALAKAASKYNLKTMSTSGYYSAAWALAYMLADGLAKCGSSCTASTLLKSLNSLGSFAVPGGVLTGFTPLHSSATNHNVQTSAFLFHYNTRTKISDRVGALIKLGPPDYTS
jgi:ABC-type branched-subunit amino acid transport system substrate-binding protein